MWLVPVAASKGERLWASGAQGEAWNRQYKTGQPQGGLSHISENDVEGHQSFTPYYFSK